MEEDSSSSNDVQAVEIVADSDSEAKPIMMLFKRLIGIDNKENTVLTNSQLVSILNKEFNMDTSKLHELEVDIYLSVMKKFLKDWPQWDEFDHIMNLIKKSTKEQIQELLNMKYQQLIKYLKAMLEEAKPKAQEAVKSLKNMEEPKPAEAATLPDVILEVKCSREQLNKLFFRQPHPERNYTVFNVEDSIPSKISVVTPDYKSILNWFHVSFTFSFNFLNLVRSTEHELKHILVNKKLDKSNELAKVSCKMYQEVVSSGRLQELNKDAVLRVLLRLQQLNYQETEMMDLLINTIKEDMEGLPEVLYVPCTYQKYLNEEPYVRYLYTEVPELSRDETLNRYDIQLQETVYPMCRLYLGKVNLDVYPSFATKPNSIQLKCVLCKYTFSGAAGMEELRLHIMSSHFNEPDWQCRKCNVTFTMIFLAQNCWRHECSETDES